MNAEEEELIYQSNAKTDLVLTGTFSIKYIKNMEKKRVCIFSHLFRALKLSYIPSFFLNFQPYCQLGCHSLHYCSFIHYAAVMRYILLNDTKVWSSVKC